MTSSTRASAGIDLNGDGDTADVIDADARGSGFDRLVNLPTAANNGGNMVDLGAFETEIEVANTAPAIVSTATISLPELEKRVLDIETTDDFNSEGAGLTYSTSGGADAALFDLDANTGVLTFASVPDFETPGDANGDNDYLVQVTVTDSNGLADVQDISVTVSDVMMDQPQTFEVTTADDELDDLDGLGTVTLENFGGLEDLSLREALALANLVPFTADTITFANTPGEAFEGGGTIRLSQDLGELVIASDVTIDGDLDDDGAPDVTVTGDTRGDDATTTDPLGNTISDFFNNNNGSDNVNVPALKLTNGMSTIDGLVITGVGGGVYVSKDAAVSIIHSSVSGNHTRSGGGIRNDGNLTLADSVVSGNYSPYGGGIYNSGTATLIHTTVSDNTCLTGGGGGIENLGIAILTSTTVSGNGGSGINNRELRR